MYFFKENKYFILTFTIDIYFKKIDKILDCIYKLDNLGRPNQIRVFLSHFAVHEGILYEFIVKCRE